MEVVADRLTNLLKAGSFNNLDRLVLLESISDLRAAYCSFCNKSLLRDKYTVVGIDEYKNSLLKCSCCSKNLIIGL